MPVDFELRNLVGDLIELTSPYRLRAIDGIGMTPVEHRTQRGPYQDGETYLGSILRPRVVTISLALANPELDLWTQRAAIGALMAGLANGFYLRATLPSGALRQLDLRYASGLDLPIEAENWLRYQPAVFQAVAHNPLWYNPTSTLWSYVLDPGEGEWAFEATGLAFPAGFGVSGIDVTETKTYTGTWRAYPVITVTGPIDDLVIDNQTTDEKLDFTGYDLGAGETLVMDLRYGYKTVEEDGVSVLDQLTTDSDLATWHIAAHPESDGGYNTLHITGDNATTATTIAIRFNAQYVSI